MKNLPAPLAFLVNSNIWISLGAVFMTYISLLLVGRVEGSIPFLVFVFGATLTVYIGHRLVGIRRKLDPPVSQMAAWMQAHKGIVYVLFSVALLCMAYGTFYLHWKVVVALAVLGVASLAYAVPLFRVAGSPFRLRDAGLLKPFLLGVIWAVVTVALPLLQQGVSVFTPSSLLLFLERALFVAAICIPFDVRDMQFDQNDIRQDTLPLRFGVDEALKIARAVLLVHLVLAMLVCAYFFQLPTTVLVMYMLSYFATYALLHRTTTNKGDYWYTFAIDGTLLLQGLLVSAAYWSASLSNM